MQVVVWGIKHEDFCAPDPSCPDHDHCEEITPAPSRPIHAVSPRSSAGPIGPGSCGSVYTKKKLMKKTVTKTIPSYKWVVEDLCPSCQAKCAQIAVPPGTEVPTAPQLAGVPVIPYATAKITRSVVAWRTHRAVVLVETGTTARFFIRKSSRSTRRQPPQGLPNPRS